MIRKRIIKIANTIVSIKNTKQRKANILLNNLIGEYNANIELELEDNFVTTETETNLIYKLVDYAYKTSVYNTIKKFNVKNIDLDLFHETYISKRQNLLNSYLSEIDKKALTEAKDIANNIIYAKQGLSSDISKKDLKMHVIKSLRANNIKFGGKSILAFRYININNRRYKINSYAKMVVNTTLNQLNNEAVVNTCKSLNHDLVIISDNGDIHDKCGEYAGNVYSISGNHPKYPPLEVYPPFHPNCVHFIIPFNP